MEINVNRVAVNYPWFDAKIGAILLVRPISTDAPTFGIRTDYRPAAGADATAYLAVLDDADLGFLLDRTPLGNRGAFDVSALVELCIDTESAPRALNPGEDKVGKAFSLGQQATGVFMYAEIPNGAAAYIQISDHGGKRGQAIKAKEAPLYLGEIVARPIDDTMAAED